MKLLEALQSRRSIRKFKPDPIPEDYVNELIEAGRLAPSGTNLQPARKVERQKTTKYNHRLKESY